MGPAGLPSYSIKGSKGAKGTDGLPGSPGPRGDVGLPGPAVSEIYILPCLFTVLNCPFTVEFSPCKS